MSYAVQELGDEITRLRQALAKKDRELELADFTVKTSLEKIVAMDKTYQQLMEKAVRFAEAYRNTHLSNWIDLVAEERAEEMAVEDPVYVEAREQERT